MNRKWLFALIGLLLIGLLAAGVWGYLYFQTHSDPYDVDIDGKLIPLFTEVPFDFSHEFAEDRSHPFLGSAIIDIEGDGIPEVFIGGGSDQADGLMKFENGAFRNIAAGLGLDKKDNDATHGVNVLDVDGDGLPDLFVARQSGVYLYRNLGGRFQGKNLNIAFDENFIPLSMTLADLNRDGHVDMFVATYIKKEKMEGQRIFNKDGYGAQSLLLLNNGDDTFRDITAAAGLSYIHNTFQGVFVDVNDDREVDLVVAYDTGQVKTYRNLGNLRFENVSNPTSSVYGFPMGVGVGDYDNDGRVDFFVSNTGRTIPESAGRGDLTDDHGLMIAPSPWVPSSSSLRLLARRSLSTF
ncbi:MAG: VCBS repeat-containing protein [Planctomycetota bacterium]